MEIEANGVDASTASGPHLQDKSSQDWKNLQLVVEDIPR